MGAEAGFSLVRAAKQLAVATAIADNGPDDVGQGRLAVLLAFALPLLALCSSNRGTDGDSVCHRQYDLLLAMPFIADRLHFDEAKF